MDLDISMGCLPFNVRVTAAIRIFLSLNAISNTIKIIICSRTAVRNRDAEDDLS